MTTDTILHKYMRHLRYIDQGNIVHLDAVELALRLALDELAESIPPTPSIFTDHRHATDSDQIIRLNDWLAEHAPDTYHDPGDTADATLAVLNYQRTKLAALNADLERLQTDADAEIADLKAQLAQLDTDNAAMIRRNKELTVELTRARQDAALDNTAAVINAQLNRRNTELVAQIATLQAELAASHTNGAAANRPYVLPDDLPLWAQPQALDGLDSEATDWWIGCAAGRHTWRSVPKPIQLRMVRHILSYGPETGSMKMTEFDAIKPDWMPAAGSHTKTLGLSWPQLNDWSVEL